MNVNRINRNQMLGEKMIKALGERNIEAFYTESKEEALKKALELIPEGSSVGWGGTKSAEQIGLLNAIRNGNYHAIDRENAETPEEREKARLKYLDAVGMHEDFRY